MLIFLITDFYWFLSRGSVEICIRLYSFSKGRQLV